MNKTSVTADRLTADRFIVFLKDVKRQKTDRSIMMAAWRLLEGWKGFRYKHISDNAFDTILKITNSRGRLKK